ncbi:MAG: DUF177 domain-containing protein [Bacteroidetes bacterium]|nr:MAG: DUF177 domain-containing protein [Bacteroidota bacterium]
MKSLDSFIIPFRGLKPGIHRYDLQIDKSFFDRFQHGEIREGELMVHIDLEKEERMLLFHFTIHGTVSLPCDRCNESVSLPVSSQEQLIVKFGETFSEEDDVVQIIPESESQYDTAPILYEYIHLALPMRRVHPENDQGISQCKPDMLAKLNELLGIRAPDPRWEKLKEIRGT